MEKSPLDIEPDEEHREEYDDPSLLPHPIGPGPGPTLSLLDFIQESLSFRIVAQSSPRLRRFHLTVKGLTTRRGAC